MTQCHRCQDKGYFGVNGLCPRCGKPAPVEQHQGEPVAWLARAVDADGTTYRQCVSTSKLTERDAKFAWGEGVMNRCSVVITPLGPLADPGEVERLREGISKHWKVVCDQRAQVAELKDVGRAGGAAA